jgi:hypothetical protein
MVAHFRGGSESGYFCLKTGEPIDGDMEKRGRWCRAPACLHRRLLGGGYEDAQPVWEATPIHAESRIDTLPAVPASAKALLLREPLARRYILRSAADLAAMPAPEYLIKDHLVVNSLVVQYGAFGSFKSFEMLAQACSIASGAPWHGLEEVRRGRVVYVAAEGWGALNDRIAAWRAAHPGADISRLRFITEPVNLLVPRDVDALLQELRSLPEPPVEVIFDTLARCMVGGDENGAQDMGMVIAVTDRIRQEFGATVALVHHSGKNGEMRGSTALPSAADTIIKIVRTGTTATFTCEKQKDAAEFQPLAFRLRPVEGTESCVLELTDHRPNPKARTESNLRPKARELLAVLASGFKDEGATTADWRAKSGQPSNTYNDGRKALLRLGYVEYDDANGGRYTLTDLGRAEIKLNA